MYTFDLFTYTCIYLSNLHAHTHITGEQCAYRRSVSAGHQGLLNDRGTRGWCTLPQGRRTYPDTQYNYWEQVRVRVIRTFIYIYI
jgi:hypothetical protein